MLKYSFKNIYLTYFNPNINKCKHKKWIKQDETNLKK